MIREKNAHVVLEGAGLIISAGRPQGSGSARVILVGDFRTAEAIEFPHAHRETNK